MMGEKLTQKIFNEEMFYALYNTNMTESTTVSHLLQFALDELREEGFDVPSYNATYDDYTDNPELVKIVNRFGARLRKLTGYTFE